MIYVLAEGRVAESGTHDQLYALRGAYYEVHLPFPSLPCARSPTHSPSSSTSRLWRSRDAFNGNGLVDLDLLSLYTHSPTPTASPLLLSLSSHLGPEPVDAFGFLAKIEGKRTSPQAKGHA